MYSIRFLCPKRSIATATFLAAALTYASGNCAFGAALATFKRTTRTLAMDGFSWEQTDTSVAKPVVALSFAAQKVHTSSAGQTFTIRGSKLTGDVTVSTNPPFSLSKDSIVYDYVLTFGATELASNQTVYVRFNPTARGTFTDSITNISEGADNKIIALTGKAVESNWPDFANKLDANNIITPNGDGRNDTWVIKNLEQYPNNTVKVFDKSGNVVFSKQGYANDWDGTYNNGPLAQGTYYYIVDFGAETGLVFKGFITIVRD